MFLVDVAAHRITESCFMPLCSAENSAMPFIIKDLGPEDLLMTDRGLTSFPLINLCKRRGTRFVLRFAAQWKPRFVQRLGPGDTLMAFKPCSVAKYQLPVEDRKNEFVLRVLEFRVGDGELVRLVTDLVDPKLYPAWIWRNSITADGNARSPTRSSKANWSRSLEASSRHTFGAKPPSGFCKKPGGWSSRTSS